MFRGSLFWDTVLYNLRSTPCQPKTTVDAQGIGDGVGTTVQKVWGMRWDGNKMVEWGGDGTHRERDSTGGAEMISIPCRSLHTGLWPTQYGRCRKHKERNTDKITVSRECTANKQECYIGKNYKQLRARTDNEPLVHFSCTQLREW